MTGEIRPLTCRGYGGPGPGRHHTAPDAPRAACGHLGFAPHIPVITKLTFAHACMHTCIHTYMHTYILT